MNRQILIVDDDPAVRKVLRFRLQDSYEIIDTGSPEEALSLALQHKPDAILLDLMMPKYSGFELCQTLSSLSFTQTIPIFIVSGESAQRYKEFCESLGAKAYFQKPVDYEALRQLLATLPDNGGSSRTVLPRVRLRVTLKLRGLDAAESPFELLTATDDVGVTGFRCTCTAQLKEGAIVDVHHAGARQQLIGKARLVQVEWPKTPGQRCDFQFLEKPVDWILQ